jgi:hypothetical protein
VCHFDSFGGGGAVQPCEAAYVGVAGSLGTRSPQVTWVFFATLIPICQANKMCFYATFSVFVAPSSLNTMMKVYAELGSNVQVAPLFLSQSELDISAMLAMMQIDIESDDIPLYMHTVLVIHLLYRRWLKPIELTVLLFVGDSKETGRGIYLRRIWAWARQREKRDGTSPAPCVPIPSHLRSHHQPKLTPIFQLPNQKQMLGQRIGLLESFLFEKAAKTIPNIMHYKRMMDNRFAPGKLTICDLTDVCSFFVYFRACTWSWWLMRSWIDGR